MSVPYLNPLLDINLGEGGEGVIGSGLNPITIGILLAGSGSLSESLLTSASSQLIFSSLSLKLELTSSSSSSLELPRSSFSDLVSDSSSEVFNELLVSFPSSWQMLVSLLLLHPTGPLPPPHPAPPAPPAAPPHQYCWPQLDTGCRSRPSPCMIASCASSGAPSRRPQVHTGYRWANILRLTHTSAPLLSYFPFN